MSRSNTLNKIEFDGYLYSFNTNNGGRFTSPNGGYAINGGNAGINSYGRHYDAIGLNAYSSQARYDDWAQAIRNYYNGTATLQEMNYFASMAGQDYAQITCQESILNNYHHNNSVINEMNDAIDLSLESGATKDLFDLANGVTGYAGIISGANYVDQNFGRISTLASLGGFDLGDGKTLVYGNNGDLVVRDNSVKVENAGETVGIVKYVWDSEFGEYWPEAAVVIGNADKTLISAADINRWFRGLNGEHWVEDNRTSSNDGIVGVGMSLSFTATIAGIGGTFSMGFVKSKNNGDGVIFTFGTAQGVDISVGVSSFVVKGSENFTPYTLGGAGYQIGGGKGVMSFYYGGNANGNILKPDYKIWGGGPSIGLPNKSGSISESFTIVIPSVPYISL
jgi:hypothetical protein